MLHHPYRPVNDVMGLSTMKSTSAGPVAVAAGRCFEPQILRGWEAMQEEPRFAGGLGSRCRLHHKPNRIFSFQLPCSRSLSLLSLIDTDLHVNVILYFYLCGCVSGAKVLVA